MKRLITAFLALILCLTMVGVAESKPTAVAVTYPLYDIAKNVMGDVMDVVYDPNYGVESEDKYDYVVVLNEEAHPWAKELLNVNVIYAFEGLELIEGDYDVFTAPINVMLASAIVSNRLSEIDPVNMEAYQLNFVTYFDKIGEVDAEFRKVDFEGKFITCNDGSVAYFANEYGVQIQDGEEACVLSTYNFPSEEDALLSYVDLMLKNLDALLQK